MGKESKDISMLDVVEAIDGPIRLNACVGKTSDCAIQQECLVHPIWEEVQESLVSRLRATRFNALNN